MYGKSDTNGCCLDVICPFLDPEDEEHSSKWGRREARGRAALRQITDLPILYKRMTSPCQPREGPREEAKC